MEEVVVYHISYDLNAPGKAYTTLIEVIKSLGTWCHPVDSTWYVVSSLTASEIRDKLITAIDESDQVIVTVARAPGAWYGLSNDVSSWLQTHLK